MCEKVSFALKIFKLSSYVSAEYLSQRWTRFTVILKAVDIFTHCTLHSFGVIHQFLLSRVMWVIANKCFHKGFNIVFFSLKGAQMRVL